MQASAAPRAAPPHGLKSGVKQEASDRYGTRRDESAPALAYRTSLSAGNRSLHEGAADTNAAAQGKAAEKPPAKGKAAAKS